MSLEVYWCGSDGSVHSLDLGPDVLQQGARTVGQAVDLLPEPLRLAVQRGELHLACYGQRRSLESPLLEGDRIELLGPVLLDVKAARSARVKAARARERGPYNRGFSGFAKTKRDQDEH